MDHLQLIVTNACNLDCKYCFMGDHREEYMPLQVAKDSVKFLLNNTKIKYPNVNFFGGEPLLCWNSVIVPLVEYSKQELKAPISFSISTNGTLLDKDKIKFIKDNNIFTKLSMDGSPNQDANRPKTQTGEKLKDLLPIIQHDLKIAHVNSLVIIPESCENLYQDIKYLEANGFKSCNISPNFLTHWSENNWNILKQELHKYSEDYIYKTNKGLRRFKIGLPYLSQEKGIILQRCSLSQGGIGVDPFGDIYACHIPSNSRDPLFRIGNIYTGIDYDKENKLIEKFDNLIAAKNQDCEKCEAKLRCNGFCSVFSYLADKSFTTWNENQCTWMKILAEESEYIESKLKKK